MFKMFDNIKITDPLRVNVAFLMVKKKKSYFPKEIEKGEWRCVILLKLTVMPDLIEDKWMFISASAFNLLLPGKPRGPYFETPPPGQMIISVGKERHSRGLDPVLNVASEAPRELFFLTD